MYSLLRYFLCFPAILSGLASEQEKQEMVEIGTKPRTSSDCASQENHCTLARPEAIATKFYGSIRRGQNISLASGWSVGGAADRRTMRRSPARGATISSDHPEFLVVARIKMSGAATPLENASRPPAELVFLR
jgi:hypothetical protein